MRLLVSNAVAALRIRTELLSDSFSNNLHQVMISNPSTSTRKSRNACAIVKGVRYVYFRRLWGMKCRVSIPSSEW